MGDGSPTNPRVSIVLNTYNRASTVPHAIGSVLAQSYESFELLVVDDGSEDDTADVVRSFKDDRVHYLPRVNGGLAAARNTGLENARGTFVGFMDDDDDVAPDWLDRMIERLDRTRAAIVTCGAEIRTPTGVEMRLPAPLGAAFDHQVGLFIPGTFLIRRDVLTAIGGYWEELRCSEQTELSLRAVPFCVEHELPIACVDEALAITNRDADEDRPLRRADFLHEGALLVLERHGKRMRRSPALYADFHAVAAVHGARLGHYAQARSLLSTAIRHHPSDPKNYLRWIVARFPPIARRVWGTWEPPASGPRASRNPSH